MSRFLGRLVVVVLLCDLAVLAVRAWGPEPTVRVREVSPPATAVVLPSGQAVVSGIVESLEAEAEVVDAVATPFTVEAERAVIGAAVDHDDRITVVWNGGRPFRIEGAGEGLDPSPAVVRVDRSGVVVVLDGSPRPLLPGSYRTDAPVAVGGGGLATPRDGLTFDADSTTTLEAEGIVRPATDDIRLDGPGTLEANGMFRIRTRDGERTAATLRFGPGAFEVTLRAGAGGRWILTATFQGPLDVDADSAA